MDLYREGPFCFYKEKGIVREMIFTGFDLEAELQEMESRGICSVWLNRHFCDNRINDLSFLTRHPNIIKVCIADDDFDCGMVSEMKQLEHLQIETKKTIDFSKLENLHTLITTTIGTNGLPPNIQNLNLWHIKFQDGNLEKTIFPSSLKHLEFYWTNLTCLSGLPSGLKRLGIYYSRKFSSLVGLNSSSSSIEELELDHCPNLTDYSQLESCSNLKKLILDGCGDIPSLSYLEKAKGLNHLSLIKTFVADKDLSYASSIPYTYIPNRKYYEIRNDPK